MRTADKQIADILARYGEPFGGSVWRVQGTAVIYHKALERIAAQAGIIFQSPIILRSERDECVMIVHGSMQVRDDQNKPTGKTRHEWSIGEAVINVNYRVSGKQAAYVYAMAEKRAKDRVVLKLIELSGEVYSEEEADEWKESAAQQRMKGETKPDAADKGADDPAKIEAELRKLIDAENTLNGVTDLMLHERTQESLAYLAPGIRDDLRAFAKRKLVDLGWKPRAVGNRSQGGGRGNGSREAS